LTELFLLILLDQFISFVNSKIASLETKISELLKTQKDLDTLIEELKHQNHEDEFKIRIETLERSERALLRKIEILQQTDLSTSLSQVGSL